MKFAADLVLSCVDKLLVCVHVLFLLWSICFDVLRVGLMGNGKYLIRLMCS